MPLIFNNPDGSRTFVNDDGTQVVYGLLNQSQLLRDMVDALPAQSEPAEPAEPVRGTLAHRLWELKKFEYAGSLNSENEDHIRWARKCIKDDISMRIRRNIVGGSAEMNREYRYRYQARMGLSSINELKTRALIVGNVFKRSIKQSDPDEILTLLNGASFHWFRDHSNWSELLEDKIGGSYATCEDCGVLEDTDQMHWAYNGDKIICENCCDRNYHWSDHSDTYVHDDDDEFENDGIIGEYHSSSENLGHIPSNHDKHKNPIYLGLELEMETNEGFDRYSKAEQLLDAIGRYQGHQYCLLENDGSLNDGFEMVTGYTGLDVHAEQLKFFENPFRGMRSHDTRTCGLHIHICKTGMTMSHASKLILFINESSNQKLIKAIARRENPDYAKIKNKKADYRWLRDAKQRSGLRSQLSSLNEDRYEALNFKNYNTVEFRMFRGTLKYSTIMSCLEFTYASWHFARDTGINHLSTDDFLKYISQPAQLKTTKFLRAYLQEKGFNVPAPVKKNPRIEQSETTETVEL